MSVSIVYDVVDIKIIRDARKLAFGIYRKPTVTDILIHNKSCHPNEHRLAGIRPNCLTHRLKTCPITQDEKEKYYYQNVED
jgi:hypothetical protein